MSINEDPNIHELVICANIFVKKDGKYLMLKRSPHKKFAPNIVSPVGGKINNDENAFIGAQRELLEEAGLEVDNMRLEAVFTEITPSRKEYQNWLVFYFSADYKSGEIIDTDEGELIWLEEEDLIKQNLFPPVREVLGNILNPNDGTIFGTFYFNEDGSIIKEKNNINICSV